MSGASPFQHFPKALRMAQDDEDILTRPLHMYVRRVPGARPLRLLERLDRSRGDGT